MTRRVVVRQRVPKDEWEQRLDQCIGFCAGALLGAILLGAGAWVWWESMTR